MTAVHTFRDRLWLLFSSQNEKLSEHLLACVCLCTCVSPLLWNSYWGNLPEWPSLSLVIAQSLSHTHLPSLGINIQVHFNLAPKEVRQASSSPCYSFVTRANTHTDTIHSALLLQQILEEAVNRRQPLQADWLPLLRERERQRRPACCRRPYPDVASHEHLMLLIRFAIECDLLNLHPHCSKTQDQTLVKCRDALRWRIFLKTHFRFYGAVKLLLEDFCFVFIFKVTPVNVME